MDLEAVQWRDDLCALFDVPRAALPDIVPCSGVIGESDAALFGRLTFKSAIGGEYALCTNVEVLGDEKKVGD
jgi:glycerol kinase